MRHRRGVRVEDEVKKLDPRLKKLLKKVWAILWYCNWSKEEQLLVLKRLIEMDRTRRNR